MACANGFASMASGIFFVIVLLDFLEGFVFHIDAIERAFFTNEDCEDGVIIDVSLFDCVDSLASADEFPKAFAIWKRASFSLCRVRRFNVGIFVVWVVMCHVFKVSEMRQKSRDFFYFFPLTNSLRQTQGSTL